MFLMNLINNIKVAKEKKQFKCVENNVSINPSVRFKKTERIGKGKIS